MAEDLVNSNFKIVVIGGSAGSLEVLLNMLPQLEFTNFPIVIVLHRMVGEDSALEELIGARAILPVQIVEDKTELWPGYVYVAPSDYHLLFEKNRTLSLDLSPKVTHSRPSIDVTFESAADAYGKNVVGILLSGANHDGTRGLELIRDNGGQIIVQDPLTAQMPFMPNFAIEKLNPELVYDVDEIVRFLQTFQ